MPLDPEILELTTTLGEMVTLLTHHEVRFRAEKLDRCKRIIENSDFYGVEQLLSFYGGMGSLNDVLLQNGATQQSRDNERFGSLRTRAWEIARDLKSGN